MNKVTTLGIDLAKQLFFVIALGADGKRLWRKRLRRGQLLDAIAQLEPCQIAMEACAGAHYWAREFERQGHEVKLLPPQHVKGYLRGQKNDYNDAQAIAEACQHGAIRPVQIKAVEQQDEQALHRIRRQLVSERTRLINQTRGLLAEYGIVLAQSEGVFRRSLPELLSGEDRRLSVRFRSLLQRQYDRLLELDKELAWYEEELKRQLKEDEVCRRLNQLPAFGPVVSSGVKSWLGDGSQFQRGRDAAAALGIVPRQHSTGGKERLLGITKRGDKYVRTLLIHGARSAAIAAKKKDDPLSQWINGLIARRGFNKAVVALANKLIRIAWVIVARGEDYQPRLC
jgi:transposase